MLAGRGFVYSSNEAAGGLNQYHTHCDCQIVPSWTHGTPMQSNISGYNPQTYRDMLDVADNDPARLAEMIRRAAEDQLGTQLFGHTVGEGSPTPIRYVPTGPVGRRPGANPQTPVTVTELRKNGAIAPTDDPDQYFDSSGLMAARWLELIGIRSVSIRDGIMNGVKTPDGQIVESETTWEAKRPGN